MGIRREDRLRITNYPVLADLLDHILRAYGPTQMQMESNTARYKAAIRQEHFSKLRSGNAKSIKVSTYHKLWRLLPSTERHKLALAFEAPGTPGIHVGYQSWLDRSRERIWRSTGIRWERDAEQIRPRNWKEWRGRGGDREGELKTVCAILNRRTDGQLRKFRVEQFKRGHSQERIALAIYRTVAPLIEASGSAFVERHWREMSDPELSNFVRAGLTRERLLLKRPVDIIRIQEVARLDSDRFSKAFGVENLRWPRS
jgi:hypothetical protein